MNKMSIKESHISPEYAAGYEDGFEMGAVDESRRIREAVSGYDAYYELDKYDDSEVDADTPIWVDGFNTAKQLFLSVIENGG